MISVRGVKKAFGKNKVLHGVDLDVEEGQVVALLGPSGSGKTTLLRCINFLEKACEGSITIDDRHIEDMHRASSEQIIGLRRKTAMVFQNYDLFLNKNVLDNVTEGLITARKVPREEAELCAKEVLTKVGLGDRLDSKPFQLSGGQQQRVGIARALALNPKVILFDEPTSALDPEKVDEILDVIRCVAKTGVTMIIVTHEMEFAYDIADKVVFMDDGKIVEQGNPKQVFANPAQERTKQFLSRFNCSKSPEYYI
ncbi:arginine ABC transporter ATP-binding protein [Clostridia bacterium]|nr:arginine ABC transporter ATP-binding protein [Clostridia bacterium]